MEKAVALALLLLVTLLATTWMRGVDGQAFCRSQISLANEACSLRNFPGARPPVPRQQQQLSQQLNETSSTAAATTARSRDDEDDDDGEEEEERQHHRRQQRHRHSADNSDRDPYDTACCRRLMAIDNACVCQASARLPVFMTSVWHVIRLTPIDGCDVTFECPGSFSPLG